MGTLDFGLHDILIYEMKIGEGKGKGGIYLENENIFLCGGEKTDKEKEENIWR